MVNSTFVSDSELMAFLNSAMTEVYDLLVQAGPPDYYASTQSYTLTTGIIPYSLPSDFRSATCVYAVEPQDRRRPIRAINDYERSKFYAPQASYTMELQYVPIPPVFTSDNDTFDGVSGWEELCVAIAARDMLLKEESDISGMEAKIANLKTRIRTASSQRDAGPRYITDVTQSDTWLYPNTVQIRGYRIRGNVIEFYEPSVNYWF